MQRMLLACVAVLLSSYTVSEPARAQCPGGHCRAYTSNGNAGEVYVLSPAQLEPRHPVPPTQYAEAPSTTCLQAWYRPEWPVVQTYSGRRGETVVGTAVAIGRTADRYLFLTAAHNVTQADPTALMADRGRLNVPATLIAADGPRDVALLSAQLPAGRAMNVMPLAPGSDPQGEQQWGGFSPEAEQYRQMNARPVPLDVARMSARGRVLDGMSGGPVSRPDGLMTGLIVARHRGSDDVCAVRVEWLRGWLAGRLPADVRMPGAPIFGVSVSPHLASAGPLDAREWAPVAWRSRSSQSGLQAGVQPAW